MTRTVPTRAVQGRGDIVVTPHELATQAALGVMESGGNAVDAAVAANAVLGVVLPTTCGPGGDLFALVHSPAENRPRALNASGRAGSGADAQELRKAGHQTVPLHDTRAITVPGCIDGWEALLDRAGSMPLADLLGPAIRAAERFPASAELAADLDRIRDLVIDQPSSPSLYPDGAPPKPGRPLVRSDLAATLRELAEGGRRAFYGGRVGGEIATATGERITPADLDLKHAEWVDPVSLDVFGRTAWTVPTNSQGYLTLAAAWIVERLDPTPSIDDPAYHHALIEAYRAVAWDRDDVVADPTFAPLPTPKLVDPHRLSARLDQISADRVAFWPPGSQAPGGTAFLCVVDRTGLGVSLIQSNFTGIGSGISAGATGVFLQNRGAGFSLVRGHPNEMAPGKRPLHTLSPTLWTRNGDLDLVLGTRGGHYQPQLLLQIAAHLFHVGLSPGHAQAAPRWITHHFGPGTDSRVHVEARTGDAVIAGLEQRGHEIEVADGWMPGWGPISIISVDGEGNRFGAADPRVSTASAGVR